MVNDTFPRAGRAVRAAGAPAVSGAVVKAGFLGKIQCCAVFRRMQITQIVGKFSANSPRISEKMPRPETPHFQGCALGCHHQAAEQQGRDVGRCYVLPVAYGILA
jgi:hypothetical protein